MKIKPILFVMMFYTSTKADYLDEVNNCQLDPNHTLGFIFNGETYIANPSGLSGGFKYYKVISKHSTIEKKTNPILGLNFGNKPQVVSQKDDLVFTRKDFLITSSKSLSNISQSNFLKSFYEVIKNNARKEIDELGYKSFDQNSLEEIINYNTLAKRAKDQERIDVGLHARRMNNGPSLLVDSFFNEGKRKEQEEFHNNNIKKAERAIKLLDLQQNCNNLIAKITSDNSGDYIAGENNHDSQKGKSLASKESLLSSTQLKSPKSHGEKSSQLSSDRKE